MLVILILVLLLISVLATVLYAVAMYKGRQVQRRAGEEERQHAEAERRQLEEEARRAEGGPCRIEPAKRGGRPRGFSQESGRQPAQETASRCPKPKIICWKIEQQWILGVEVPEDLLEKPGLEVFQNELPLTQDQSREGCWRLEKTCGKVVVQWNEDEVDKKTIELGERDYLLFKQSGKNQNQGRRVKSPSSGSYLVIAPDNWERDDTLSGPPPVTPESVFLHGYQAHFFELEKDGDGKIAFRTPSGEPLVIESMTPQFELVGNRLRDATEKIGPLFGERPPQIRAPNDQTWKNVGTIVVGEEGSGKGTWRIPFSPNPVGTQQDLPPEVAARKCEWYFLRFYDTDDDLIESLDFRFISALKEIRIPQRCPFPSEDGHGPLLVESLHEPSCAVQSADDFTSIQIESQNGKTILTIPPDPTCDRSRWLMGREGGPKVEVVILVERLWWAISEEDKEPAEWEDQLLTLSRDDSAATSKKALWLRLPRRRWVNKVLVGFEQSRARPFNVKVMEKPIAVPLREFGDSTEVGDGTQKHSLKVWIERGGRLMEGVVAIIPASVVAPEVVSLSPAHWVGLGRKKTAIARAVLRKGTGIIKVNGQPDRDYFKKAPLRARRFLERLLELPTVSEVLSQMEVSIEVTGSSPATMRQARAVAHALARALISYDPKLKPLLKQAGFGGARVKKRPACNGRDKR